MRSLTGLHSLTDDGTIDTGVLGDLTYRCLYRPADDVETDRFVTLNVKSVQHLAGAKKRDSSTRNDALLDRSPSCVQRILDAGLLLLHLDLGGRPDIDLSDTTRELCKALLELLAVVIRCGFLHLGANLVDPALDVFGGSGSLDERGSVLLDDDLLGTAEERDVHILQVDTEVIEDGAPTCEGRNIVEHRLTAITETRRFHRAA